MTIHNTARFSIFLLLFLVLQGCISYKIPVNRWVECKNEQISANQEMAANHWLYTIIPRHRSQIKWFDVGHWITWAIFGNDDDGIFGEGNKAHYRLSQQPSMKKGIYWFARNPLHNFCFYVIGSAHRINSRVTIIEISRKGIKCLSYSPESKETFPDIHSSSFSIILNGGKPFVASRIKVSPTSMLDFYAGWRPRGNFGLKLAVKKPKNNRRDCKG